jgi:hypothetical protein
MKTDPINWRLTSEAATAASAVAGVVEIDGSTLEGGGQVMQPFSSPISFSRGGSNYMFEAALLTNI